MYNVARHNKNDLIQCNIKFSYLCLQLTSAENELAELNKALEDQEQQFEDEISKIREEAELQRVRSHMLFLVNIDFRMSLDRLYDHKSFKYDVLTHTGNTPNQNVISNKYTVLIS